MSGSASAAAPDPRERASASEPAGGEPNDKAAQRQDAGPSTDRQAAASPPVDQAPPQAHQDPPPAAQAPSQAQPEGAADPYADFLITSQDRDEAEARLRQAVADDALTLDEFGDRMRILLGARTRGDLRTAVAGLPSATEPLRRTRERGTARPAPEQKSVIAVMSETATRGRWRPAPETTALAIMGSSVVDLQGAEFEGDELKINAIAFMGGVEIIVPEGVEVQLTGFSIMGDRTDKTEGSILPDAPIVHVDGYAVMGGVEIRHPKPKERREPTDDRGAFADRVPLRARHGHTAAMHHRKASVRAGVKRWVVGLLAAAALAVPVGWTLASDDVAPAVFGSAQEVVSTQGLEAGEELTIGAPLAFGSVAIEVPEGVNVERDGFVIFGSTECPACAAQANPDAPTVRVKTFGGFGSVEITRVGAPDVD